MGNNRTIFMLERLAWNGVNWGVSAEHWRLFFLGNEKGKPFFSSVHSEGSMELFIKVVLTGVSAVIYREAASPRIRWLRIGQFPIRVSSIHLIPLTVAIDIRHIVCVCVCNMSLSRCHTSVPLRSARLILGTALFAPT